MVKTYLAESGGFKLQLQIDSCSSIYFFFQILVCRNSKDCEQKALTAFLQMDHSMVRSLRGLREKLGYKWPPKIRQ